MGDWLCYVQYCVARMDVPALTVLDEFIVPVDMVEAVHEVRYTTGFTDTDLGSVLSL